MRSTITYAVLLPLSLLSLLGLSALSTAETIKIPVGQQNSAKNIGKPTMGLSMEQVEAQFGEPQKREPAKGQPPITRWEYKQFVVYFENNTAIHSVVRYQRNEATGAMQ